MAVYTYNIYLYKEIICFLSMIKENFKEQRHIIYNILIILVLTNLKFSLIIHLYIPNSLLYVKCNYLKCKHLNKIYLENNFSFNGKIILCINL